MWDEQKGVRFQQLRRRQDEQRLSEAEQTELARLTQELEAAEGAYLGPATERLRQEREKIELQNRGLEKLVRRKEALVLRLRNFLTEAQSERRAK